MEKQVSLLISDIELVIRATEGLAAQFTKAYAPWVSETAATVSEKIEIGCSELKFKADRRNTELSISEDGNILTFESGICAGEIDTKKSVARFELCPNGPEAKDGLQNSLRVLLGRMLIERSGLLLHAAAVRTANGKSVVFAGRSGAGKTTLSGHFSDAGREVYSDDLCCLKLENDGAVNLYSAPLGSDRIGWYSGPRRLSDIFLLGRSDRPSVSAPLARVQAAAEIAASVPFINGYGITTRSGILQLAARIAATVPVYRAKLRSEPAAVKLIEEYAH